MAKTYIVIGIDDNPENVPGLADWKEVLFNLGAGPEEDWPNTIGYAYTVKSIFITDEMPVMKDPLHHM